MGKATGSHPPSEIPSPALGSPCGDPSNYPEQAQAFLESEVAALAIDPSFLQTPAWAQVKAGWQSKVIGFFEAKELVGTALVLARKCQS